tara:strand:- start:355 stop:1146 length:792 start_codon:yes stop_codon:yes gene_type:complete
MTPQTSNPATVAVLTHDWIINHVQDRGAVRFVTPTELANELEKIHGSTWAGTVEVFNMTELKDDGKSFKRMNKTGNPFIDPDTDEGKAGLFKVSRRTSSVCFDYETKREVRAEQGEDVQERTRRGSHHTPVMKDGKITPLSVHKDDIVCRMATADEDGVTVKDTVWNKRAVNDDDGNTQFIASNPRLYLRYEIRRESGDDQRQDRKMLSQSEYYDGSGKLVDAELVKPYLPKSSRHDGTDFQTTGLDCLRCLTIKGTTYSIRR